MPDPSTLRPGSGEPPLGRTFNFILDEEQVRVWERYAQLRGISLERLVQVTVPEMTNDFLLLLVNPAVADQVEEAVLRVLPAETQELLLRQRRRLTERLAERGDHV